MRVGGACSVVMALVVCGVPAMPVAAFVGATGDRVIVSEPLWDDAYFAGGKVVVDEEVGGDASVAGGSLIITAPVAGDLNATGLSVVVNGTVGDDLRALGGDINLGRDAGSDLMAFGGSVSLSPKMSVGGDAAVAAYQIRSSATVDGSARMAGRHVVFEGIVRGDAVLIAAERLEINGVVEGAATVAAPEITLGPEALFGGDVEYWRESGDMDFGRTLRSGAATYNPALRTLAEPFRDKVSQGAPMGFFGAWMTVTSLAGAVSMLLMLSVARGYFQMAAETLRRAFWRSFGTGILYLVLTPLAAVVMLATVAGIPLGILLACIYALSLIFAKVATALVMALWLERKMDALWTRGRLFVTAFAIFLFLKALMLLPFAGWAAALFLVTAAFGSMVISDMKLFRQFAS